MNLYLVTIREAQSLYREHLYIPASAAKIAIDKAYKRFEQKNPDCGWMLCEKLELVEEDYR